jgi:hypothetical protein
MQQVSLSDSPSKSTSFQQVTLRGGPHDGQTMNVPADCDRVELADGDDRHLYRRFNSKPTLYHDSTFDRIGGVR